MNSIQTINKDEYIGYLNQMTESIFSEDVYKQRDIALLDDLDKHEINFIALSVINLCSNSKLTLMRALEALARKIGGEPYTSETSLALSVSYLTKDMKFKIVKALEFLSEEFESKIEFLVRCNSSVKFRDGKYGYDCITVERMHYYNFE